MIQAINLYLHDSCIYGVCHFKWCSWISLKVKEIGKNSFMVSRKAEVGHISLITGGHFRDFCMAVIFLNSNRFFVLANVVAGLKQIQQFFIFWNWIIFHWVTAFQS